MPVKYKIYELSAKAILRSAKEQSDGTYSFILSEDITALHCRIEDAVEFVKDVE